MITRTTWARYDQSRLLTGNGLTGVGIELDRRVEGLVAEADCRHLAAGPARGFRRGVGLGLVRLGTAIHGVETRQPVERRTHAG
jgi:hypothetical protein